MRTLAERQILAAASEIKRAERKQAVKARVKPVVPTAKGQRQPRKRDPKYLQWVRRLPCTAHGLGAFCQCDGHLDAAHVRYSAGGRINPGMQQKPDDAFALSLCRAHHTAQHGMSEAAFWRRLGIDPGKLCEALYACFQANGDGAAVVRQFSKSRVGSV